MLDVVIDGIIDTLKILPYLLITFIVLEFIEHNLSKESEKVLTKNKKYGPVVGSFLGALPQCGFSSMAANLFSSKIITIGTLVAVFLSTSDEMLPIMLSEKANILLILKIIGFKVLVGLVVGIIIDLIFKSKDEHNHINEICTEDNCDCEEHGIFLSSLIHTLKTGLFILIANLLINIIIFKIGEDNLSNILLHENIFKYFIAGLVGLIPNCASSVILTQVYLSEFITVGTLLSGLLTGSGLGILLLFKTNKNLKENLKVLFIIFLVGVIVGLIVDLFI